MRCTIAQVSSSVPDIIRVPHQGYFAGSRSFLNLCSPVAMSHRAKLRRPRLSRTSKVSTTGNYVFTVKAADSKDATIATSATVSVTVEESPRYPSICGRREVPS